MKSLSIICALILSDLAFSQTENKIITSDIDNFWQAFDVLKGAKTRSDSIEIIQTKYIDKASSSFKEFVRIRGFTAEEYVDKIGSYPMFWRSVRSNTLSVKERSKEIGQVLEKLAQKIPNFKSPKVCFAIGCLRTGGTVSGNLILIGTEIASADQEVDKTELSAWLQSVIGKTGDITAMVAHEAIHTQQIKKGRYNLLTASIAEGSADFLTSIFLNMNINSPIHAYGQLNECALKEEFFSDLENDPTEFSNWLFNGGHSTDRPADLGYYIGYKISEAYFNNHPDKEQAISDLLNRKKYKQILKVSGYKKAECK